MRPGAVIVAGDESEPFLARVVDISDGPARRSVVHLEVIGVPEKLIDELRHSGIAVEQAISKDRTAAARTVDLFVGRGQLEAVAAASPAAARSCLDRARKRMAAVDVLLDAEHWEAAFTTAYDAYRTSADAIVLVVGYRVPAVKGAHRVSTDVAHAALKGETDAFGPVPSDRFRSGRHESEYFDPDRPMDKTEDDARWAASIASAAVAAVAAAVG